VSPVDVFGKFDLNFSRSKRRDGAVNVLGSGGALAGAINAECGSRFGWRDDWHGA